jgi:hypothetical protein
MSRTITETMPASAFSSRDDGAYSASALTRGLWHPNHQHAGPAIALACRGIEAAARPHGLTHVARITANLLRPLPLGEIGLAVATEHAGRNVGHFSARLMAGDKDVARFTAMVHREHDLPVPNGLPGHPLPLAPKALDESQPAVFPFEDERLGYSDLVEVRVARGAFFKGPSAVWLRMLHPLLDNEEPSVYQRVAVMADSCNGISSILDMKQYSFVNPDLTINLLRRPLGEWFCLDARTHLGPGGCGHAEAEIYDSAGLIGRALQTLVVSARG